MRILLTGDIMLGRLVNDILEDKEPAYPWGDTLPIFKSADLAIGNLECALTDSGKPWLKTPKVFHFRSDSKNVNSLLAGGFSVLSLANNHILDFNERGLEDTLTTLKRAGIKYAGAGVNMTEAQKPVALKKSGITIGFIAFTDNQPEWEAAKDRPGTFYAPIDPKDKKAKNLLQIIKATKRQVDLLIVSAHWGPNWGYEPPSNHRTFGRAMVGAGADIVYGHSAHVFRGIEIYKNHPILYSTGNFVDDYAVDDTERNDEGFIYILELERSRPIRLRLYPTIIKDFQAQTAKQRASGVANKLLQLSARFGTIGRFDARSHILTIPIEGAAS